MRKLKLIVTLALIFAVLLTLTSCTVRLGDSTVNVPWFVIAIPIIVLVVIIYIALISKSYVCPHCKQSFKPKFYDFSVIIHVNGKRLLRCPHCEEKGFCERE